MKVTVLKTEDKQFNLLSRIVMLILGVVLFLNAHKVVTTAFIIIGGLAVFYGAIKFYQYFKQKKEINFDDKDALVMGVMLLGGGLLTMFLASVLSNTIQVITGIWLLYVGLNKVNEALLVRDFRKKEFIKKTITAIIILILGVYTLLAQNVVFMLIGTFLILTSLIDIYNYLKPGRN